MQSKSGCLIFFIGYIESNREKTMTEEEKMRQGLLYDANYDEELLAERRRCKELCFELSLIHI